MIFRSLNLGDHMLIMIPEVCTHLLDIGATHEPACHVTTKPLLSYMETQKLCLTSLITLGPDYVVNLATLDLIEMVVPNDLLVQTFKSDTVINNKLSIIHYFIVHTGDMETAVEVGI